MQAQAQAQGQAQGQALWAVAAVVAGCWLARLFFFRLQRAVYLGLPLLQVGRRGRRPRVLAFFHPYCECGGGGERVLWVAIEAILTKQAAVSGDSTVVVIYSGGGSHDNNDRTNNVDSLLALVKQQFRIDLRRYGEAGLIKLVNIKSRWMLEAKHYPVATMLCQCLASMAVGLECVLRLAPDVYVDTTGAAFTYPVFALLGVGGSKVACYVHYPIISSDMLQRVREHRPAHNNDARIAQSVAISSLKVLYYRAVALLYSLTGLFVSPGLALVNSSWTEGHMEAVWGGGVGVGKKHGKNKLIKVYPPCNTQDLQKLALSGASRSRGVVLSVGQFRPEKDHSLQLRAFADCLAKLRQRQAKGKGKGKGRGSGDSPPPVRLVLLGGTRNAQDEQLVLTLKQEAQDLGIADCVEFVVNAPFAQVRELLATASVGLHTMWNEHFGISIVEMMAAGLVVVAHNSGGPRMDIVVPALTVGVGIGLKKEGGEEEEGEGEGEGVGFLAATVEEYAQCLVEALEMGEADALRVRKRARAAAQRFSDEEFSAKVLQALG